MKNWCVRWREREREGEGRERGEGRGGREERGGRERERAREGGRERGREFKCRYGKLEKNLIAETHIYFFSVYFRDSDPRIGDIFVRKAPFLKVC